MYSHIPNINDGFDMVQRGLILTLKEKSRNNELCDADYIEQCAIRDYKIGRFETEDILACLAQPFLLNYPVVEICGNYGNIYGDVSGFSEWMKVKLSDYSVSLFSDLQGNDYCDLGILNILINGTMHNKTEKRSNIPPHNIEDIINCLIGLIDNPSMDTAEIIGIIKGPDFPTGGVISDFMQIDKIYKNGKGTLSLSAKYKVESYKNNSTALVIYEIPYLLYVCDIDKKLSKYLMENLDIIDDWNISCADTYATIKIFFKSKADRECIDEFVKKINKKGLLKNTFEILFNVNVDSQQRIMNIKEIMDYCVAKLRSTYAKNGVGEDKINDELKKNLKSFSEKFARNRRTEIKIDLP